MITTANRRGGSIATGNLAAGGGECPAGLAVPPEQPPGRCLGPHSMRAAVVSTIWPQADTPVLEHVIRTGSVSSQGTATTAKG